MAYDLAVYADANLRAGTTSNSSGRAAPTLASLSAAALALTPVTLDAIADTYSEDGSPTTNFGSSGELRVKKASSTGANREAVLKFDLGSLGGAPAASAVLRVYGKLQDTRQANVVTDVYATNTAWTETGVNWNNRPAAAGAKLGSVTVQNTTAKYYDVDLSAFVQSELAAGRTTIAVVLKNPSNASPYTTFNSRNAANNKPRLVVTPSGPAVNAAPSVAAGPDQTITLPATVSLTGTVADDGLPSGAVATSWIKFSGPGAVTFGNAALASTTAAFSSAGTYVLRLTANDGESSVSDDVTIVVNPAGAATSTLNPTADSYVEDASPTGNFGTSTEIRVKKSPNAGFNREGVLKFDLAALTGTVTSVTLRLYGRLQDTRQSNVLTEVFATTTSWTETGVTWNTRPAAVGARVGSLTVVNTTARYYDVDLTAFVQAERAAGRTTIGLLLKNPGNSEPYTTFGSRNASTNKPQLVVSTVPNIAPSVSAGADQTISITDAAALAGAATDDGLPSGALATTWSKVSGPGTVTFGDASAPATTAAFSSAGTYLLRLTASDGALTASDEVLITVLPPNESPVVSAGGDFVMTLPSSGALAGTVTDDGLPTGGSLTTAWSLASGPGTAAFADASAPATSVTFSHPGQYVLRLTASDGLLSASDDVVVTVNPVMNQAPAVNAGADATVVLPDGLLLNGTVTDDGLPDAAPISTVWSLVSGPGTVTFGDPSLVDTTATFSAPGTYVLRLTANDSELAASDELTLTVVPNAAPAVDAGPNRSVTLPGVASLDGTVSDATLPVGGVLSSTWTMVSGPGAATFGNPSSVDTTVAFSQSGSYVLRLTASDGLLSASDDVNVTVNAAVPAQSPFGGTPVNLPGLIELENFDEGGEGLAFHDTTPSNLTGAYRATGVDVEPATDAGGGFNVGNVKAGEWTEYTVNITTAGNYTLLLRAATATGGGTVHVEFNGVDKTGPMVITGTGGWQNWATVQKTGVSLQPGQYVVRLSVDSSAWGGDVANLNWMKLQLPPAASPWPSTWQSALKAPIARFEASSHVLNGKIYVFGGFINSNFQVTKRVDSYDPSTNTWTQKGNMPAGLAETHLGVTDDGTYIYFAGGFAGNLDTTKNPTQTASGTVWRYNPANDTWLQLASLTRNGQPIVRGAGGLAWENGKLHYFGGNPADRVTNLGDHVVLDLAGGGTQWTNAAPMPNPKDHFSVAVLAGKIYAIGGEHGHDQSHEQQSDVHVYDPATNAWTQLASMPIAKSHMEGGTFVYNGRIVFAGGQTDNFNSTSNVIEYDPVTDQWSTLAPLPVQRQGAVVAVVGNKVILTLGGVSTSAPQSETYIGLLPAAPAALAADASQSPGVSRLTAPSAAETALSSTQVLGASSSSSAETSAVDTSPVTGAVVGSKTYILSSDGTMLAVDLKTDASQVVAKASAKPYGGGEGASIQAYAKKLFVFGGAGASAGKVQVFDTKANKWSTAKSMPFAGAGGAASSLIDGKVYIAGGVVGASHSATDLAARFDLAEGKWKVIAPLALARTLAVASTDGVLIYVSAGRAGAGNATGVVDDLVQVYDPKRNKWTATGAAGFPGHPPA